MKFEVGDRVQLATTYYVNRPGDCTADSNVVGLRVGTAGGEVVETPSYDKEVIVVKWDEDGDSKRLNVNVNCLEHETPTDEEIAETLQSIKDSATRSKGGQ